MANILDPGRTFLEAFMLDYCQISRDTQGFQDDVLDEVTGELVSVFQDSEVLYESKCVVTPETRRMQEYVLGEVNPLSEQVYRVYLPLSVSDVREGDVFRLLSVGDGNDESLIGIDMRVSKVFKGTFRPGRKLHVQYIREDLGNARG